MSEYRYTFKKFVKDWMLIIGMAAGAGMYLVYHALPGIHQAGPFLESFAKTLQPLLLFCMLFLSFCKIEPHQMRPHKWQAWLLLVQGGSFLLLALIEIVALKCGGPVAGWLLAHRIPIESAMICLVCPTATACAVVTGKLGGNMAGVITYTVVINILVAVLVPLAVPMLYPSGGVSFGTAFCKILAKVFPLLIMPCIAAWVVRYVTPSFHARLLRYTHVSFYIWAVSLALAIAMSTRALVNSSDGAAVLAEIAAASLACCAFQFWIGKRIGARYGCRISAGQALGQKNTVFGIWTGYTFFDPVTSVACGFYSIWHNCYNTWQLYRKRKEQESKGTSQDVQEQS